MEGHWRLLVESTTDVIWTLDLEGKVTYVSPSVEQVFGYRPEEVLESPVGELFSAEALELAETALRRLREAVAQGTHYGRKERFEFEGRRKDGSKVWTEAVASAVYDSDGAFVGVVGVTRDITERRRTEEALQRRVEELSTLSRIARVLATVTELPSALATVAEIVAYLLDASSVVISDLRGSRVQVMAQFARDPACPAPGETMAQLVDAGEAREVLGRGRGRTGEGTQACLLSESLCEKVCAQTARAAMAVPLQTRGTVVGMMCLGTDQPDRAFTDAEISLVQTIATDVAAAIENARLYEQAQIAAVDAERQRLARELHDSVTQSLYSTTLLANGWGEMADQGRLENPGAHFRQLEEIGLQALKEMRLLILQLRPPILEEKGLVMALKQRLEAVEQRVSVDAKLLTKGEMQQLPSELEEQLFHIAQEALNNALRHAGATSVTVEISVQDGLVCLAVQDDGRGLGPDARSPGMGMENMRDRAKSIGGRLEVTSSPGHGTTVTVTAALEP